MSKILAVFGATGQQGSSVIHYILHDAELSRKYKIRAITRDVDSEKSKQLKQQVEVVRGDVLDRDSLETALAGVHTVFAMTTPSFTPDGLEVEYNNGKAIADTAVAQGVDYIIFSTLPNVRKLTGGKFPGATHFDGKAKVEEYIRSLPIKSAFHSPGFFMENFHTMPFLGPKRINDDTWAIARHNAAEAKLPMIDAIGDTGKFVGAILAEPEKYEGKTFCAATAQYSLEEVASILSKATGKKIIYNQVPVTDFKESLPFAQDLFIETFSYPEEFGYYGPDSDALVAWAARNARGKVSTFEEYLEAHPIQLE